MTDRIRGLQDLNQIRVPLEFDDIETGDPIRLWLYKLTGAEAEAVDRQAGAAKASILMDRDDETSDEFMAHMAQLLVIEDQEVLIPFVAAERMSEIRESTMARVAADDKWATDDKLAGLQAAWLGDPVTKAVGLHAVWEDHVEQPDEDPDDPTLVPRWIESQRVYEALKEFQDEVSAALEDAREELFDTWRAPLDENDEVPAAHLKRLRTKAAKVFIQAHAEEVYVRELVRQRAFYTVRKRFTQPDDHGVELAGPEARERYFQTLADYDACSESVKARIEAAYENMALSGLEGKEWLVEGSSSLPSESPDPQETVAASGQKDASA